MSNINQEIIVYNKNGEFLAKFTKDPPIDTANKINMMIDPTVSISQNGESTFTFSINFNSQKWKDIQDPENIYLVNGREYTALSEDSFVYGDNIVEVNLVETWYLLSKVYIQAYNVPPEREGIDEHTVVILPKSTEPLIVNGVQYDNNPYPRGSAGYALWALLQGSGWNLGICDVIVEGFSPEEDYGVFNLESDQKDLLHNIQMVQELWGGILVWDSVNKTLNLRDENKWDTDNGYEIRKGKNLKSAPVITQNNDVITRLYPLGESKLNIKKVNNDKTYLENFSYTDKIYSRILQNSNIYDQNQLKFWGERKLSEICKPSRYITAELIDIRTVKGFEHEVFDLNDIATIVHSDPITGEETKEKQRIIKWTYNVFAPENCSVELGNKTKNVVEIIKQSWENSEKADDNINDSGNIPSDNIWDREYGTNVPGRFDQTWNYISQTENRLEIKINDVAGSLADFIIEANNTFATIEALTQFKTDVTNSIAGLQLYVDSTFATIESFTAFQTQVSQSLTSINQRVDENAAEISINARHIEDNSDNIAEVRVIANRNESKIELNADKIEANGRLIAKKADISDLNALSIKVNDLQADMITASDIRSEWFFEGAYISCDYLFANGVFINGTGGGNFRQRHITYVYDVTDDGVPKTRSIGVWCYA